MWRLLVQAGLGFATFDIGRRIARAKRTAVHLAIAAPIGLLGLMALTAAGIILLEPKLGWAGSAGAVGGGLLLLAGLIGWIGTRERKPAKVATPVVDRVRAEVAAAGAALSSSRAARRAGRASRAADDPSVSEDFDLPPPPGARRKRALNMVLIATLAGVVLGRRL